MVGNPGHPVVMLEAQNDFASMTVLHWNDRVAVGDRMLVGREIETAWTYVVATQSRSKRDPRGFEARLIRHNDRLGVAGMLI